MFSKESQGADRSFILIVGMQDVGIYRVSGLASEIQRLKKAFEKSECWRFNRSKLRLVQLQLLQELISCDL